MVAALTILICAPCHSSPGANRARQCSQSVTLTLKRRSVQLKQTSVSTAHARGSSQARPEATPGGKANAGAVTAVVVATAADGAGDGPA